MPVYEYRCKDCGTTFEIQQGFHDERPTTCERCGGKLVRIYHPVGLVFKGSGFHTTDYRKSTGEQAPAKPPESKPDAKPAAEGTKTGESKPASSAAPPASSSPEPKKQP